MEGPSNGGLLYHEVQESKLCAVHCVNTVLQGPFFTELDLAALASDLDQTERQMMAGAEDGGGGGGGVGEGAAGAGGGGGVGGGGGGGIRSEDFLAEDSHNVSVGGDFSIQVLEKALQVWDLKVIPLDAPVAEPSKHDPELETAYICHLQNHWFCIRKVNGEWYNFNSLYAAPEHLTKFYLSAYLDTLKGAGWSIFLVRGEFPKECPMSSDSSNGFGQWLTPEDAKRIIQTCNQNEMIETREQAQRQQGGYSADEEFLSESDYLALQQEQLDLDAAIQASLMDNVACGWGGEMMKGSSPSHEKSGEDLTPGCSGTPTALCENSEISSQEGRSDESKDLGKAVAATPEPEKKQ